MGRQGDEGDKGTGRQRATQEALKPVLSACSGVFEAFLVFWSSGDLGGVHLCGREDALAHGVLRDGHGPAGRLVAGPGHRRH